MEKKEKSQIIIYDGEEMHCFTCMSLRKNFDSRFEECFNGQRIYTGTISSFEAVSGKDIIELDPTMMKRIAKYNAEREVDILIRKKKVLEDEIEQLEEDKNKQIKKIESLVTFCKDFVEADETNIDEYIDNNYIQDDYDDYD